MNNDRHANQLHTSHTCHSYDVDVWIGGHLEAGEATADEGPFDEATISSEFSRGSEIDTAYRTGLSWIGISHRGATGA